MGNRHFAGSPCYTSLVIREVLMPVFEVNYNFTCPTCVKYTEGVVTVTAANVVDAREFAVVSAGCANCHQPAPKGTFVTTVVREQT